MWLRLLQNPAAWRAIGVVCDQVETIETHRAWVFLAADRVLKFKKPCREACPEGSSLAQCEWACREELRLNQRLAPGVYLGLVCLLRDAEGLRLAHAPVPMTDAQTLDWAILMRRLPATAMLDQRITNGPAVSSQEIDELAAVLARFWASAPRAKIDADGFLKAFALEHRRNAEVLGLETLGVRERAERLLARQGEAMTRHSTALRRRADEGRILDGHGDLRPEHIALLAPPVVIDALEFDATLRAQDPFDELAYLGMECARLGAPEIGPALIQGVSARLGQAVPSDLLPFYTAHRALLRARLALGHLLEHPVRHPLRWPLRAAGYLQQAQRALDTWEG